MPGDGEVLVRVHACAANYVDLLVFRGLYGDIWIEHLLTNLPGGVVVNGNVINKAQVINVERDFWVQYMTNGMHHLLLDGRPLF